MDRFCGAPRMGRLVCRAVQDDTIRINRTFVGVFLYHTLSRARVYIFHYRVLSPSLAQSAGSVLPPCPSFPAAGRFLECSGCSCSCPSARFGAHVVDQLTPYGESGFTRNVFCFERLKQTFEQCFLAVIFVCLSGMLAP